MGKVVAIVKKNGQHSIVEMEKYLITSYRKCLSLGNNIVFDGEVMSDDFQALMKQVYRKSGANTEDAYLALFDIFL